MKMTLSSKQKGQKMRNTETRKLKLLIEKAGNTDLKKSLINKIMTNHE